MNFMNFDKSAIEQSIASRFEEQVSLYPEQIAVKAIEKTLTYAALNQSANQLAHLIIQQCPLEQQLVPILFDHSAAMLIAILGILKAGKAWVSLDCSYPKVRLETILDELNASFLVTNQVNLSLANTLFANPAIIINLDQLDENLPSDNLGLTILPEAIACILYTSGSTGKPKGVIQTHRNLLHLVWRGTNTLQLTSGDRLSLLSSYCHMGGTNNILRALLNGATLLPHNIKKRGLKELSDWIIDEEITIYHSVPTVFRHFIHTLEEDKIFSSIRAIHLGGEPVCKRDVELFKQHFSSNCRLLNNLGCTELSGYRQYFMSIDTEISGNIVPAGYATEDIDILLLDDNGREVATGSTGEVILRSAYLSPGYWQQPEQTNKVFFLDPQFPDLRCYRTGDIGYILEDGCFIPLGRKDFQVQIRGYRVEIGEIEAALFGYPKLKEAAVIGIDNAQEEKQLIAYIVPKSKEQVSNEELDNYLRQHIPDYMIPSFFITMDQLPITPNGKINRLALPYSDLEKLSFHGDDLLPQTDTEKMLLEIWILVLERQKIGINNSFFLSGGDSLKAMKMIAKINSKLGLKLAVASLFENPTITEWAKYIDRLTWLERQVSDNKENRINEIWEEIQL